MEATESMSINNDMMHLSGEEDHSVSTLESHASYSRALDGVRLIAFFLTQFHPTPENDRWWGKGFTEWTNVTKASPLFNGHYQPHLPTDLGFYDLRLRETRQEQIRLAKQYGIDGFCYHYYWFSGTRILNRPLDEMLSDRESEMPFCLCWANENWTRRWDAAEHQILISQKYLPDDDLNFIKSLIPFFLDPRYIKVDGAPFLIVYRPQHLPDPRRTVQVWREYCEKVGIGKIHICAALTHGNEKYCQFGFDSGVEFPPHNLHCRNVNDRIEFYDQFYGNAIDYQDIAQSYLARQYHDQNVFKTVFPSWDNTARARERALIVLNGTPHNYEYWLSKTLDCTMKSRRSEDRFVFINAWNEWAEGCHLEPDRHFKRQFLEATLRAKNGLSAVQGFEALGASGIHAVIPRSIWGDLRSIARYHGWRLTTMWRFWLSHYPRLKGLIRKLAYPFRQLFVNE
ncbi:MAG: Glycosyltransferase [Nitrospira sp.]|jgi:lipopolysaccharide biosynthesis protein|nr:MAG: Glycosyltransferase [Nitrospira sp.]